MPFVSKEIGPFRGLNEDESPEQLRDDELTATTNVSRNGSAYGTRPGVQYESAGTGNYDANVDDGPVLGGTEHRNRTESTGEMLVLVDDDSSAVNIYTDDTTTIGAGSATISQGAANRWTFAHHDNRTYAAGGADGDSVWYWANGDANLTVVTFQNATPADIDAKYIFQKWNYGFLAGMDGTDPEDNPMTVRFSALGDMTVWPAENTIGGTSSIGGFDSYGDNVLTGFSEFHDNQGDWLLCLSRNKIFPVLQVPDPFAPFINAEPIANGCVHQLAYANLGLDTSDGVYISERGIHSVRQSQQFGGIERTFLSWKIRSTFSTANRAQISRSCAVYEETEGYVVCAFPTGSNTAPDTLAVLDVRGIEELTAENAQWSLWTLGGITVNTMWVARDASTGKRHVYIGTTDGNVCRFTRDAYNDLSTAYDATFTTKHDSFGSVAIEKVLGDVVVVVGPGGSYKPTWRAVFDRGRREGLSRQLSMPSETSLFGTAVFGVDTFSDVSNFTAEKVYGQGAGETIAHKFFHNGSNEPFWVTRIATDVHPRGEITGATE